MRITSRSVLLVLGSWSILSCGNPCLDACDESMEFWDACYPEILAAGINISCYENVEALGVALAEAGSDPEARLAVYQQWLDSGQTYTCEDAAQLQDSCHARVESEFEAMTPAARHDRTAECSVVVEPSPISEAMANLDCQGFIDAVR